MGIRQKYEIECTICREDVGTAFTAFMEEKPISFDAMACVRVDISRLDGTEKMLILCPDCAKFMEKKLKLAWAELTKKLKEEKAEEGDQKKEGVES